MRSWEGHWERGDPDRADAFNELGPEDARMMLVSVGIEPTNEPEVLRRDENRVFWAAVADGFVVLKVFRFGRNTAEALEEDAATIERLAALGLPLIGAQRLPNERFVGELDGQLFSVFPWVDGRGARELDLARVDFPEVGSTIAQFHLEAGSQSLEHRLTYTPNTWGDAALTYLLDNDLVHPAVRQEFEQAARQFLDEAQEAWPEHPLVPVHSDLDPSNLIWRDGPVPSIIDFEELGFGSPVHDTYRLPYSFYQREYCSKEESQAIREQIEAGYRAIAPLPDDTVAIGNYIEGIRGISNDCFFSSRRHDRHYGGVRLTAHTKSHWQSRLERLERYRGTR